MAWIGIQRIDLFSGCRGSDAPGSSLWRTPIRYPGQAPVVMQAQSARGSPPTMSFRLPAPFHGLMSFFYDFMKLGRIDLV